MSYVKRTLIRFAHCDAAGIVFYPRYFEMLNAAVEDWFAEHIGISFMQLHDERRLGVPTVTLTADFVAPGRLGEVMDIAITVEKMGRTSCALDYLLTVGGEARVKAKAVLVCMSLETHQPAPWPEEIRAVIDPALSAA